MVKAQPRWPKYLESNYSDSMLSEGKCFREDTPTEIIEEYRRDVMGPRLIHRCPECGYEMPLSVGTGYHSNLDWQHTRTEVLNGVYGSKVKKIFESNPESSVQWYSALFHCRCGNYQSKSAITISLDGKSIYRPSERCRSCKSRMWEVKELPHYLPCPKCSTLMKVFGHHSWD